MEQLSKEKKLGIKTKTNSTGTTRGTGEQGDFFKWMKAHLFWHSVLPAASNLDTFKYIDLIVICRVLPCTHVHKHSVYTHRHTPLQLQYVAQGQRNNVS